MNRANGLTRQSILAEIKNRGSVTTDELGQDLGISSVAVRQHLSTLAAEGKVSITVERRGLGRPVHRYQLTTNGDETFDRAYDRLSVELLETVQETQGNEGLNALLAARRHKLTASLSRRLHGVSLGGRVEEIARFQDGYGYMVSVQNEANGFVLTERNCAICQAARAVPALCTHELEMLSDLAGPDAAVVRESHILAGDVACVYRFSPKATPNG
jgi:predicted ArsR family transcriptional regulator